MEILQFSFETNGEGNSTNTGNIEKQGIFVLRSIATHHSNPFFGSAGSCKTRHCIPRQFHIGKLGSLAVWHCCKSMIESHLGLRCDTQDESDRS